MTPSCIDLELVQAATMAVHALAAKKMTVITAESCTAGLISAALAEVEGAADTLHGGFVTYIKANKAKALGVSEELLASSGSVSPKVAEQLARGALERSPADIAPAVTGVLGPEEDEDANPVGKVVFCCRERNGKTSVVANAYGNRPHAELQRIAVCVALRLLTARVEGH